MNDFYKDEYIYGIYAEAFDAFLEKTGFSDPESAEDAQVGLFLLICDLALNPARGFPLPITTFHNFITDVDPAIRFHRLCIAARDQFSSGLPTTFQYTRESYIVNSDRLSNACGYDSPMLVLNELQRWLDNLPNLQEILQEKESFCFSEADLPVRVVFSHFIAFSANKKDNPEFFCWPGICMIGENIPPSYVSNWLSNLSLYSNRLGNDGVFPRDFPGKDKECVLHTLNVFYANGILFDLTKQWILENGNFHFDYRWMSTDVSEHQLAQTAANVFENFYGVRPDEMSLS